jgi:hypothetical protein
MLYRKAQIGQLCHGTCSKLLLMFHTFILVRLTRESVLFKYIMLQQYRPQLYVANNKTTIAYQSTTNISSLTTLQISS